MATATRSRLTAEQWREFIKRCPAKIHVHLVRPKDLANNKNWFGTLHAVPENGRWADVQPYAHGRIVRVPLDSVRGPVLYKMSPQQAAVYEELINRPPPDAPEVHQPEPKRLWQASPATDGDWMLMDFESIWPH